MKTTYLNKGRATAGSVEKAAATYRGLKIRQRQMPLSEQWTMGPALKVAYAAWLVEKEELEALR